MILVDIELSSGAIVDLLSSNWFTVAISFIEGDGDLFDNFFLFYSICEWKYGKQNDTIGKCSWALLEGKSRIFFPSNSYFVILGMSELFIILEEILWWLISSMNVSSLFLIRPFSLLD